MNHNKNNLYKTTLAEEYNKTRVLVITNMLPHYRISFHNELAKCYNLHIVYSYGARPEGTVFSHEKIELLKFWKFRLHKKKLSKISKGYDIIIAIFDFFYLSLLLLLLSKNRKKVILWGMGVSGSTTRKYDSSQRSVPIRKFMMKRAGAVLFYSDYPKEKYTALGLDSKKMFVAHNTTKIEQIVLDDKKKKNLLFVGKVYKSKNLNKLFEIYKKALAIESSLPYLDIVGSGEEWDFLNTWVENNGLSQNIVFHGVITNQELLTDFYKRAIASISLGQAGLSVQQSMGYGVPFITTKDAYTGGEIFDICDETGVLLDREEELVEVLIDIANNREKYLELGRNAYHFYWNNRTPAHMVNEFESAINFVIRNKK